MNSDDALNFMEAEGWLSTLPGNLRSMIRNRLTIRRLAPDEPLFHAGDVPGGLVGLAQGVLVLEALVGPRPPQPCFLLHTGSWTGEGTTAGLAARVIGLRATRPSIVALLGRTAFHQIASDAPDAWRYLSSLASENNLRAVRMADALMERDSRKRLALVLLILSGSYDPYASRPAVIDMDQITLAATANMSRSAASPILRALQDEGILVVERKAIRITGLDRLRELVDA